MQEVGGPAASDRAGGAGAGEMGAGLQMDDTGVATEAEARPVAPEALGAWPEEEEEEEEETAGGVNWPLLSEPVLSRAGEDFFFKGRALALPLCCCCCRHLALRFLNHTWGSQVKGHAHFTHHRSLNFSVMGDIVIGS